MRQPLPEPRRWRDEHEPASVDVSAAGETLRSLPPPEPLSAVQLARIAARIRAAQPKRLRRPFLLLASLLLGVATAASAAHLDVLPSWMTGKRPDADGAGALPAKPAPRKGRRATAIVPVRPEPEPAPIPEPVPPPLPAESSAVVVGSAPAPVVPLPSGPKTKLPAPAPAAHANGARRATGAGSGGPSPWSPAAEPVTPPPSGALVPAAAENAAVPLAPAPGLSTAHLPLAPATSPSTSPTPAVRPAIEPKRGSGAAKSLSEVVRALRISHDARTALALLERNAAAMTRSGLGQEVVILRVEALLALGREAEVLRLLDGTALTDVAASHSLLVTRGRLRAAAKRCVDGVGDFDLVLAESRQPDRQALFGRALCRKQLGDASGARADLERYRREFPADPHLGDLERQVAGSVPR